MNPEAETDRRSEAEYLLRKLLTMDADDLAMGHAWLWEVDRWKELVFALLTRVMAVDEARLREITDALCDLDLLDIPALAGIAFPPDGAVPDDPRARHILDFLQESGAEPQEAWRGLTAICDAARGLQQHFGGKVQRYLRSVGESMVQDIGTTFQFGTLKDAEVTSAFTYWLQNVLCMPLSLLDEDVLRFCEQHQLTPGQLLAAADDLDLNLAFLDDLIQRYLARQADTVTARG